MAVLLDQITIIMLRSIPEDAACLFFIVWDMGTIEHIEEVKMILLNRANRVLGITHLSRGGLSGSIIDTRVIL
jgi:hypothetical protein